MSDIPITKPYFDGDELEAVQEPIESGWVVQGPYVEDFEDQFSDFSGADYTIATTSCTSALHLAVKSMGLEPDDEVIVPAFTWVATANCVAYEKADPVFCDINLVNFNIDVDAIERHITDRTVGIIPVHLFGLCANMSAINELADQHDLWVVEDAACGMGAWIDDRHAGTFGDAGCFSFHPRKSITTGEGGMVATQDPVLNELLRSLRDHGATRTDRNRHEEDEGYFLPDYPHVGYNYRMTDIQAAVGCAQMHKAEEIISERRQIAERYDELLFDLDWIQTPRTPEGYTHGYQSYVTLYNPEEPSLDTVDRLHSARNKIMNELEQDGIATRPGTHAAAFQDVYVDRYDPVPSDFPNAYLAEKLSVSLPIYVGLTESDQERVVDTMRKIYEETIA
jgi:perosamine synthetase